MTTMNNKVTIGRAIENDIVVNQSFGRVSNEHGTLEIQDGQLVFIDHSTNGTMINGRRIHHESIAIRKGDKILLADSYELAWPTILQRFPSLQRSTERFDGSQIESSGRQTEVFDPSHEGEKKTAPKQDQKIISETQTIGKLNDFTQMEVDEYLERFNFGALLSSWVWALRYKTFWPLLIIPISLVPFVGQVCSLFLCAYLGIKGNRMSWNKTNLPFRKFMSSQKIWIGIGIFLFPLFTAIQFIAIYYILLLL